MVIISRAPALSASNLQVFHTTDPALSNSPILVLYGPSATSTVTASSLARIQCHVFTSAGFQSYPKIAISPGTPLYSAVSCLSREEQGDEILRALAYCIYKYFGELPEVAKETWSNQATRSPSSTPSFKLFSAAHAALLASRMIPAEDAGKILLELENALQSQVVSQLDADIVLPAGTVQQLPNATDPTTADLSPAEELDMKYGKRYAPLIQLFGEPLFLPTSKIQRAPSRPMAVSRTLIFAKKQKEALRREINELVDTEESYIDKLNELVLDVAEQFRQNARSKISTSTSPDEQTLQGLFPPCLSQILDVNSSFFDAIRKIADDTEESAIRDIGSTPDSSTSSATMFNDTVVDATGVVDLSEALLTWLPKFSTCYGEFIQAQPSFAPLVKDFAKDATSSISQRIHETGEQRLMSLLIEPVQRLPRYSLYIDNISKQLPVRHPALKTLLKAKDVVSAICDQGNTGASLSRLPQIRSIIPSWPSNFRPQGRFISAIDVIEHAVRRDIERGATTASSLLVMLFAGCLVFARKHGENAMSAASLVSEVQKTGAPYLHSQSGDSGLLFLGYKRLSDYSFSHTEDNDWFTLTPLTPSPQKAMVSPDDDRIRQYQLTGVHQGRAQRWITDILKAKVEARFSEVERESGQWEARSCDGSKTELGLITAVFADGQREDRGAPAATRVMLGPSGSANRFSAGQCGVEIVASVTDEGQGFYRLEVEALNERGTRDRVTTAEFLPVLTRRRKSIASRTFSNSKLTHVPVSSLLQMRSQIRNPALTAYLLQHHNQILNSLSIATDRPERGTTRARNKSPSKLLSSLFGNISLRDNSTSKDASVLTPVLHNVPRLAHHQRSKSLHTRDAAAKENETPSKVAMVVNDTSHLKGDPFASLEHTLMCYLLALKARKGNIVGSVVARRAMADEAAVNQLYNALLEDSDGQERAANSSVDLIFAAFERFIHVAWRERLGPVIPAAMLSVLQSKMGVMNAFAYDEFEEQELANLAPQNRRALSAIVATLADLLEGTRNDGDRGALTAAIAEIVVCDADPHSFITLFDRFVEDQESLSDRPNSSGLLSVPGSASSTLTGTTKNGSISSKASSLGKRLGFGSLRRANSNRSQKALPPDPPLDKPLLARSNSQDLESQLAALRRPASRDKPSVAGSSDGSRPGTGRSDQDFGLPSESVSPIKRSGATRKKRRSSLSDLTTLQTPITGASPFWTNSASKKVEDLFQGSSNQVTPSRQGFVGCTPLKSASVRYPSPIRNENNSPLPHRSQTLKEHSPSRDIGTNAYKLPPPPMLAEAFSPLKENESPVRRLPSRREPLSERVASGNTPPPLNISPKKLNTNAEAISSPTKRARPQTAAQMSERVAAHQSSINATSTTLQEELAKIGQELASLSASESMNRSPSKPNSRSTSGTDANLLTNLTTRLRGLETRVTHLTSNLSSNAAILSTDITTSLAAADRKAKELDKQLHAANAENDVLYNRMNEELMKVFEQVRKGEGVEEMRKQLKERNEETEKWKREVMKLRRENAALKGALG